MKSAGQSKDIHIDTRQKHRERIQSIYRLDPQPSLTSYSPGVIFESNNPTVVLKDDPLVKHIKSLAKNDRIFYERLHDDKAFHHIFWYLRYMIGTIVGWLPTSPTEEIELQEINKAGAGCIEYMLAQNVLPGKYFHLLSQPEQLRLFELAQSEIMNAEKWLSRTHPIYQSIHNGLLIAHSQEF
jgi:hypothetical protein